MQLYNYVTVQDFISLLEKTVGYLEKKDNSNLGDLFTEKGKTVNAGSNNYTIIAEYYKDLTGENYQAQAWCAMFVSVMFAIAFGIEKAKRLLYGNFYSYCPTIVYSFGGKNIYSSSPKVGDIVVFHSSTMERYCHTGIVVQVNDNGSFTTIEGNTSSQNNTVIRNGGCIAKKTYNEKPSMAVFCRPDWLNNCVVTGGELPTTQYNIKGTLTLLQDTLLCDEQGDTILAMDTGAACVVSKKKFVKGKPLFYCCYKHTYGWADPSHMKGWVQELDDQNRWWYLKDNYTWYSSCVEAINDKPFAFNDSGYCITNESIMVKADSNGYLTYAKESE